jgi:putative ABC transport system ATP-binding protein
MPEPLVELCAISKHFGEGEARVDALADITLSIFPGEVVGLVGPSGSGKTTLLNVIGCITEPSSGWIRLNGEIVYDERWLRRDLRRLRLEKIGFIFQTHNLLPFLTASENVMEVLELAGASSAAARSRAADLLDYLQVGNRMRHMPAQLSGGEAQRVAGIVMDLLRRIASEQQAAIICVTHDETIFDRFDRIFHLRDGRLVATSEDAASVTHSWAEGCEATPATHIFRENPDATSTEELHRFPVPWRRHRG